MSEEEKKAIEIIKFLQNKCIQENGTGMMAIYRIDDLANAIETVLNLIENQQKEIEYLKSQIPTDKIFYYSYKDFISKDKIKAKIEELENEIEEKAEHGTDFTIIHEHEIDTRGIIEVLQALLEEE